MKYLISTFFVLFLALQSNFAQTSFCHGVGAGYGFSTNFTAASPIIVYAPRLNFMTLGSDDASLGVGTHLGLGGFVNYNSRAGADLAFGFDLPVTVSANFGHFATPDSDAGFGGFVGAGFGYGFYTNGEPFNAFGPVAEAGLRAIIFGRPYTGRLSYLHNLGNDGAGVATLSLIYNLGM